MEKKENNFAHENTWRIRNDIDLKCWIRIRIEINKDPKHSFNKLLQIFNIKSDLIQIHNAGRDVKLLTLHRLVGFLTGVSSSRAHWPVARLGGGGAFPRNKPTASATVLCRMTLWTYLN